jgi:hypothetical protein
MVHLPAAFVKDYSPDRTLTMSFSGYVVEGRAHLLARIKLAFDLLLALGLYLSDAPLIMLLAPAIDLLLLVPYLRYVKRSPALLTFAMLALWAGLLALAPLAMGAWGLALWALFPLIPASAGFVLGRRPLLWQMTLVTAGVLTFGVFLLLQAGVVLTFDRTALAVLAAATLASILLTAWLMARVLQAESGNRDMLGQPVTVVRGVLVAPLNWAVGGVQVERLRQELDDLKRSHNPRWIVLDMAPAGQIGRHDLHAVERAAEEASTAPCAIVIARPPVDAISHLDVAQAAIGRVERFATVAQAVEAGLRRLGWTQQTEQGRRIVTTG